MNVKFIQYDDEVYYEPLNQSDSEDISEYINEIINWYQSAYQTGNIKIDLTVGLGLKFLDIVII